MYIHEAALQAIQEGKHITRKGPKWGEAVKITPTKHTCWVSMRGKGHEFGYQDPRKGWQPNEEDLIADDWIVIGDDD